MIPENMILHSCLDVSPACLRSRWNQIQSMIYQYYLIISEQVQQVIPVFVQQIIQSLIELSITIYKNNIGRMSYPKLSNEQTTQMLKLEQLFHNRYLNPEFLHQLIAIYVKAIEQFNHQYRFMRTYFMEKMQFVLASPEIVSMLEGGGKITDSIRETIRMTERPVIYEEPSVKTENFEGNQKNKKKSRSKQKKKQSEDRFKKKNENKDIQVKHTHEEHHYYHYDEQKNNQKGLKIDMKMKLMRQVEENMKNFQKEVNEADQKLVRAEEKVKDITKTQEQILNERLAKRKKKLRKKSVQIKAQIVKPDGEDHQPEPEPVIKKEELVEAHRELTRAIFMYTIRMTQKQRERQNNQANKVVKGRVKKAKDLDDDEMLIQEEEQAAENEKTQPDMTKNKSIEQAEPTRLGRIKTTRRHLDSDDDS